MDTENIRREVEAYMSNYDASLIGNVSPFFSATFRLINKIPELLDAIDELSQALDAAIQERDELMNL